jgi:hypothetical protein
MSQSDTRSHTKIAKVQHQQAQKKCCIVARLHTTQSVAGMRAPGANIGARGADTAQDILHGGTDRTLVREDHRLSLTGPVLSHSAWGLRTDGAKVRERDMEG